MSHTARLGAAAAAAPVALALTLLTPAFAIGQRDPIEDAVERYARGEHDAALAGVDTRRMTVAQLTSGLDRWIASSPDKPAWATTAVMFALELTWKTTRTVWNAQRANHDPWKRVEPGDPPRVPLWSFVSQGLVGRWCAEHLADAASGAESERLAWLATNGVMHDGSAWHAVLDVLPKARARLGPDPRLHLAETLARVNIELGPLRLSTAGRVDLLRDEPLGSTVTRRIPGAIRQLDALLVVPELTGEVHLRSAYFEMRRRQWDPALERLARALSTLTEPVLLATAHYFTGWIHEHRGRTAMAIDSYREAHRLTPLVRNLSTSLAALLFENNQRAAAYAILDAALNATDPPDDLLKTLERGDARFVREYFAAARRGLR